MTNEEIAAIANLANNIGTSAHSIVSEYTRWYFCYAITRLVFGGMLIYFSIRIDRDHKSLKHFNDWLYYILVGCGILIGALVCMCALPGLIAPQADAIDQLIRSSRGDL